MELPLEKKVYQETYGVKLKNKHNDFNSKEGPKPKIKVQPLLHSSSRQEIKSFMRNKTQSSMKRFLSVASSLPETSKRKHEEDTNDTGESVNKKVRLLPISNSTTADLPGQGERDNKCAVLPDQLNQPSTSKQQCTEESKTPKDTAADVSRKSMQVLNEVSIIIGVI